MYRVALTLIRAVLMTIAVVAVGVAAFLIASVAVPIAVTWGTASPKVRLCYPAPGHLWPLATPCNPAGRGLQASATRAAGPVATVAPV
jgi:hypothetical protein